MSEPVWVGAALVDSSGSFTTDISVPMLAAGDHTLQINITRQGQLPVSVALGISISGGATSADKTPNATSDSTNRAAPSADLVFFTKGSSALSAAAKRKLNKIAANASGASIAVTGFSSTGRYQTSPTLAKKRASVIAQYLKEKGVSVSTDIQSGSGSVQSRTALIRVNTSPIVNETGIASAETVSSLIVRYKRGVKPSADNPVTGTENVTIVNKSRISLGEYLGFRMYLLNFSAPLTKAQANRVAAQVNSSKKVEFAEPNGTVSTQVSISKAPVS